LAKVFNDLDLNKDKKIERNELHKLFMDNRNFLAQPFLEKLKSSMLKLDQLTNHPIQFAKGEFVYFVSSLDKVATYNESVAFCKYWGGQLLELSSATELSYSEKLFNTHGNSQHTYWYGSGVSTFAPETEPKINGSIYSECKEFNPFQANKTAAKWAATCEKKNEFICKKTKLHSYHGA
jgi:hypothetical protein